MPGHNPVPFTSVIIRFTQFQRIVFYCSFGESHKICNCQRDMLISQIESNSPLVCIKISINSVLQKSAFSRKKIIQICNSVCEQRNLNCCVFLRVRNNFIVSIRGSVPGFSINLRTLRTQTGSRNPLHHKRKIIRTAPSRFSKRISFNQFERIFQIRTFY